MKAHSLKFLPIALGLAVLAMVTACTKSNPAAQCGTSDAQKAYLDTIYATVSEDEERDMMAIGSDKAMKDVRDRVAALRTANPAALGAITAEHYDEATGNLDCRVEVTLNPSRDFATESVKSQARDMEQARETTIFPTGFFDGKAAPMSTIFELRRDASGKQTVHGGAGFPEIVKLLRELLSARSLSDDVLAANPGTNPNYKTIDATDQALPAVGQCFDTTVHETGYRLEGMPDSGTSASYEDGHTMVDYTVVPAVSQWQRGDPIKLCVISLPTDCPKGDNRGVVYKAKNLRTRSTWMAADSEHECGGA